MNWRETILVKAVDFCILCQQQSNNMTVPRQRRPMDRPTILLIKIGDVCTICNEKFGNLIMSLKIGNALGFDCYCSKTVVCTFTEAWWSALRPDLSWIFTFVIWGKSFWRHDTAPCALAMCHAVSQFLFRFSAMAPDWSRMPTASFRSAAHARCNGVNPSWSFGSIWAPFRISDRQMSWPREDRFKGKKVNEDVLPDFQ